MEKSRSLTDFTLIVFGEDFGRHPHALEHLMRPFLGKTQIYWVETVGLRSPKLSFYDLKRIFEKLYRFVFGFGVNKSSISKPTRFKVLVPFMIPYNRFKMIRWLNQYCVRRTIDRALDPGDLNVISIASVPQAGEYVGFFNEKSIVYFCVDDFEEWPGLDKKLVSDFERKLISRADLIFATSRKLCITRTKPGRITPLISHGVDLNHFSAMPTYVAEDSPIRLCYFGLFDERSDQELLAQVIAKNVSVELHVIGPIACEIKQELKNSPRVIFHGRVSYQELPSRIKEMHVLVLPYVRNELTKSLSPLKLKEYLATEKPVLSTRLNEVEPYEAYAYLANTADEWIEFLSVVQSRGFVARDPAVRKYLEDNETWAQKAKLFEKKILESLNGAI